MKLIHLVAILLLCFAAICNAQSTTAPSSQPALDLSAVIAPHSRIELDIPYVEHATDQQMLDVYAPRDAKDAPTVIYLHGGEWAKRDKQEVSYKPRFFNQNGIILVSANYRLSGAARHPAQVNDVAASIKWVRDNISRYGGDPTKVYLMGHSAGCHLATLVGLDPKILATVEMKPSDLAGVISWSGGAFDLVEKFNGGGMYATYIKQCFGDDESVWRDASPVNHVGEGKPMPRFLLVSAERDNASSIEASKHLAGLIKNAGGDATTALVAGKNHGQCDHDLGAADDPSNAILLDWINPEK